MQTPEKLYFSRRNLSHQSGLEKNALHATHTPLISEHGVSVHWVAGTLLAALVHFNYWLCGV